MKRQTTIALRLWLRLVRELKRRGRGVRESGAFLLAKQDANRVVDFVCYDEMDPTALDSGIVVFHGSGFVRLWDICSSRGVRVIADVHTHGGRWTGQSDADRTHPMVAQSGHLALILPHFARRELQLLRGVGIYEYLGNHEWSRHAPRSGRFRITPL